MLPNCKKRKKKISSPALPDRVVQISELDRQKCNIFGRYNCHMCIQLFTWSSALNSYFFGNVETSKVCEGAKRVINISYKVTINPCL